MRTVLLASLRTHTRRYVSAALAVVIGVAFVIVTAGLSAAARDGLTAGVATPYAGADVVVTDLDADTAGRLVREAPGHDAQAAVLGWVVETVRRDGATLSDRADVAPIATDPALRWPTLVEGAFPTGPGEAAVDATAARRHDVGLGDTLEIGSGARSVEARVVALVDSPSLLLGGSVYLTWPDLQPLADRMYVDSLAWAGPTPVLDDLAPDATVTGRDAFVAERQTEVDNGVDVLTIVLLVFATVALVVGVLVIANTFSILFAQRRRDLALLRCVGATRRQVLGAIRAESLALGLVATALGLAVGTLGGLGVVALVDARWPQARLSEAAVSLPWYAGGLAVGLLVTVAAAWLPTRRAVRTDPLAALRPDVDTDVRSGAGRLRLAAGAGAVAAGAALLAVSVAAQAPAVMLAGGTATFCGVLVLGPWLVPALIRLVGPASGRLLGPPARLAAGNAVRHPKRTAATAASLLVGVTLTTAVLTGLASARGALASEMDSQHPLDAALVAPAALPGDLLDRVRRTEGVAAATALDGVTARVAGVGEVTLLGVDDVSAARDRGVVTPGPGEVLVPDDLIDADHAARVEVAVGGRTQRLRVVTGEGWGESALVAPATLRRFGPVEPRAVWVSASDGADADTLGADLEALAGPLDATVENGLAARAYVDLQLDVLTGAVVGLLGVAVVIALIGIANTLGLSVLERGREHALLRALGLTRRQLRGTLAVESVLLSVVATLLGTALGVLFAWVGVQAMVRAVVEDAPMVVPGGQLAVVVLVSAVAGLLACLLPARRAARVSPASGLASE